MRDITEEGECPRCQKCDKWRTAPECVNQDPMILWDSFPCPPPGHDKARLLLELDWKGQLGNTDGCKALRRVAERCKIDLGVNIYANSVSNCDDILTAFSICGTHCVIAIVLACICLLFVLLLAGVCYRYCVRRNDKEASPTCTKVISTDQTALNTHVNRYYMQSQYYYRAGNIPDRRGLPYEARSTENGVEARLIKAIQQAPRQASPFEDMCSQCMNGSRHSTLSNGRTRHGYERIYWKDREYLQKRVPSNDSLHRKTLERHRSRTGSSSDMSHFYEYISDTPCDVSSGRRSNHSAIYFPRHSSLNLKEMQTYCDSRHSDDERGLMLSRYTTNDIDYRDNAQHEIVPHKMNVNSDSFCRDYRDHYGGSLSDHYADDSGYDPRFVRNGIHQQIQIKPDERLHTDVVPKPSNIARVDDTITGYKYTYNPSFDEDTTTSKQECADDSSSAGTPSECVEIEEIIARKDLCDTMVTPSPTCNKRQRTSAARRTPCVLPPSKNSELAPKRDASLKFSANVSKKNASMYPNVDK